MHPTALNYLVSDKFGEGTFSGPIVMKQINTLYEGTEKSSIIQCTLDSSEHIHSRVEASLISRPNHKLETCKPTLKCCALFG